MPSNCIMASFVFLHGHSAIGRAKSYGGGYARIVRKSCDADAAAVQSPKNSARKWYGVHADSLQSPRGHVRPFFPNGLLNSCDFHKISARPPHDAHAMFLRFV